MKKIILQFSILLAAAAQAQVSAALDEAVRENPEGSVEVALFLAETKTYEVAQPINDAYSAHMLGRAAELKAFARTATQRDLTIFEQQHKRVLLHEIDRLRDERKISLRQALAEANGAALEVVAEAMRRLGGEPTGRSTIGAVVWGKVPSAAIDELAAHPAVGLIELDTPNEPTLNNHKHSLGLTSVNGFWNNGYTGGVHDIGILDTGAFRAHTAFNGFNWEGALTDSGSHGTGVTGIAVSKHATNTGVAYGLHTVLVATDVFGSWNTFYGRAEWIVLDTIETPEVINFSGASTSNMTSDYSVQSQFVDSLVDTFDITWTNAAANAGPGNGTVRDPSSSYNALVVANMDDENTVTRADDLITSSSSRGPTPGGRKKPDITAPGTNSMTTNPSGTFSNLGGTSSAAPHVAGAAILLRDFGVVTTYGIKAVLINSSDTWSDNDTLSTRGDDGPVAGRRWDRTFGFGYMNLERAHLQAGFTIETSMPSPSGGVPEAHYYLGTRPADAKYTLAWNKHTSPFIGEPPVSHYDLSNLELVLYDLSSGSTVDSSTSAIDNVEQVYSAPAGLAVLKVHTTGNFAAQVQNEGYGLGLPAEFNLAEPPTLTVDVSAPTSASPGTIVTVIATITNTGDIPARNVSASIDTLAAAPSTTQPAGTIAPGASVDVEWEAVLNGSFGTQTINVDVESVCWGSTFTGTGSTDVELEVGFVQPTSHTVVRGINVAGTLASVFASDDDYLSYRPGIVFSTSDAPVVIEFTGTSPVLNPSALVARVESAASSASIRQRIEAFNHSSGLWVSIDDQNLTTTDNTLLIAIPHGVGAAYVHPATGQVRLRLSARAVALVFQYPWVYRMDQVGWQVTP